MFTERRRGCYWTSSLQHWTCHTFLRPDSVRYNGFIHRGNIQRIRPALEREPLLFPSSRIAALRTICALDVQAILKTSRISALRSTSLRFDHSPPRGISERTRCYPSSKPVGLSRHECINAIRVHSRREPSCFSFFGTYSHHCIERSKTGQSLAEHMAVWE